MAKKPAKKLDGVSDKAVQKATGHVWSEWFAILDKSGAKKWDHREIVAYLKDNYELTDWWQQSVTVAYEKSTGRRAVGQTADTGFQVGVQKALPIDLGQTWSLLASHRGIALCETPFVDRGKDLRDRLRNQG